MKAKLKEKYTLPKYLDKMHDKALTLKQHCMSVAEYMQKFDELMIRSEFEEDVDQTAAQKAGMADEIKRQLLQQPIYNVNSALQAELDAESYNQSNRSKPSSSYDVSKIQVRVVGVLLDLNVGKLAIKLYRCPRKHNLHIGIDQEKEETIEERVVEENSFDNGTYVADDLEYDCNVDTSLLSLVRRILRAPKVEKEVCGTKEELSLFPLPCPAAALPFEG
ncbi:Uncharacterized protein TCM_036305 [Theobroma cacao]|uniref:Retrotransposon gag domain-containing protein n=1 Tax=Theobroma cacao TaxID=3641 RepID=A0A061FJR1_THECC|nr:Uncharacterized protein TCM_036305 [Theobroma cacao]